MASGGNPLLLRAASVYSLGSSQSEQIPGPRKKGKNLTKFWEIVMCVCSLVAETKSSGGKVGLCDLEKSRKLLLQSWEIVTGSPLGKNLQKKSLKFLEKHGKKCHSFSIYKDSDYL